MSEFTVEIEFDNSDGADKTIYEIKIGQRLIATVYTRTDADLIVGALDIASLAPFLIGDV
jgi:hypothetical protein